MVSGSANSPHRHQIAGGDTNGVLKLAKWFIQVRILQPVGLYLTASVSAFDLLIPVILLQHPSCHFNHL
jgi:hypothetical protein